MGEALFRIILDMYNQPFFGTAEQQTSARIRMLIDLQKYLDKAADCFEANIAFVRQRNVETCYAKRSFDAFMHMAFLEGFIHESVGKIFEESPIPPRLSEEDKTAYLSLLNEKKQQAFAAALAKYKVSVQGALPSMDSEWLRLIRSRIDALDNNKQ
jgi:hypothetical protein